jgi:O-antigen/teichoic acid export membrane protein
MNGGAASPGQEHHEQYGGDGGWGGRLRTLWRSRWVVVAREGSWLALGQLGTVLIALAGLAQLTRFLPPDEFGRLALALSVGNLFTLLGAGVLAGGGARFLQLARASGESSALLAALANMSARRTVLLAGIGLSIVFGIVVFRPAQGWFALCTLVYAVTYSAVTAQESLLNAGRLRGAVALHKMAQQALNYGFAFAMLSAIGSAASVVLIGFICGTGLTAWSEYRIITRRLTDSRDGIEDWPGTVKKWHGMLREYLRPFERWAGVQWLQSASDRWILSALRGTGDAGLYAVVYQLGYSPLGLLSVLLAQTMDPVAFARAGDGTAGDRLEGADRLRHLGLLAFAAVTGTAVVAAFLLHGPVFAWLVDPAYQSVSPLLPWMALAAGLSGLGQMQGMKWMTRLQPERLQLSRIVGALLGVMFVGVGAYLAGVPGVVAGQVLYALLLLMWTLAIR